MLQGVGVTTVTPLRHCRYRWCCYRDRVLQGAATLRDVCYTRLCCCQVDVRYIPKDAEYDGDVASMREHIERLQAAARPGACEKRCTRREYFFREWWDGKKVKLARFEMTRGARPCQPITFASHHLCQPIAFASPLPLPAHHPCQFGSVPLPIRLVPI